MRAVGEAVDERSSAGSDCVNHLVGNDHRPERRISAGEALCGNEDVGSNSPMVDGKVAAGATHSSHDLVGDQQNFMAATDFSNFLEITRRGNDGAESRTTDRLQNDGRDFTARGGDRCLDFQCILLPAVSAAVRAIVCAAIAIWGVYCRELAQHGPVYFTAFLVPGYGDCAQRGTMIALVPANNLATVEVSDFHLKLPCKLQRCFDGFGSAAGEIYGTATKIRTGKFQ